MYTTEVREGIIGTSNKGFLCHVVLSPLFLGRAAIWLINVSLIHPEHTNSPISELVGHFDEGGGDL